MRRAPLVALVGLLLFASGAQAQQPVPQSGGILNLVTSATTVTNTTTAGTIYSYSVGPYFTENFKPPIAGAASLHVRMLGTLSTPNTSGGVGSVNVGCNYGGSTATLTLLNAFTFPINLASAPLTIDLWLGATGSATEILHARWATGSTTNEVAGHARVSGTTSTTARQTLTCSWQWASANASNSVTISHAATVLGN